jgi:hypothetical protein
MALHLPDVSAGNAPCVQHVQSGEDKEVAVLDERLTVLLAEELGVPPEEITPEFVQNWLERHHDEVRVFEFRGKYGGFNPVKKIVVTRAEIKENAKRAARFWSSRTATASR